MLDQLCYLLIELDHVWFAMNEVLDLLPGGEEVVAFDVALGLAASEAIDNFAKHLTCCEGLNLWLLDPQNVVVAFECDVAKGVEHLLFDDKIVQGSLLVEVSSVVRQLS